MSIKSVERHARGSGTSQAAELLTLEVQEMWETILSGEILGFTP